MKPWQRFGLWLAGGREQLAVAADLSAEAGWRRLDGSGHDRAAAEIQAQYADALTAWRKNPMAWRIIQITTDYTIANGISLASADPNLSRFITAFWHHPQNHIGLRLEGMADELARAGDFFPFSSAKSTPGSACCASSPRTRSWILRRRALIGSRKRPCSRAAPTPVSRSAG